MAKHRKSHGHYCKVCGQYRANEKFSGKGHAAHICKDCAKLSPAQRAEEMTLNRLFDLPWYLSKEQIKWLRNRTHDSRPEVREAAQEQYDMRFKRYDEIEEFDEGDIDFLEGEIDLGSLFDDEDYDGDFEFEEPPDLSDLDIEELPF